MIKNLATRQKDYFDDPFMDFKSLQQVANKRIRLESKRQKPEIQVEKDLLEEAIMHSGCKISLNLTNKKANNNLFSKKFQNHVNYGLQDLNPCETNNTTETDFKLDEGLPEDIDRAGEDTINTKT